MSRERALERRLHALRTLDEAVRALRSLSAQHFRVARALLPSARAYRQELEPLLGALAHAAPAPATGPAAVVLVTADFGLVGDYVPRLVRAALELRAEHGAGPLLCLGRRALGPLARAGVHPDRVDPAPPGAASLTSVLLPLVEHILQLHREERLGSLWLVAARFEGAGSFRPLASRVLPIAPTEPTVPLAPSPWSRPERLRAVLARESLYATLWEALVEALASEHGKRLVTAESARSWLAERTEATRRAALALRREGSTQEVIEVANAARLRTARLDGARRGAS